MAMAVLFQCLLCVKLYECHIKYAGRFLDIKEISNIPDCHDIGLATTEICQYLICLQLCLVHITVPEYQALPLRQSDHQTMVDHGRPWLTMV